MNPDSDNQIIGLWAHSLEQKERLFRYAWQQYKQKLCLYVAFENKDMQRILEKYPMQKDPMEYILELEGHLPVKNTPTLHREKISKESYPAYAKVIQEYFPDSFWALEEYLGHAIDTHAIYVYKELNAILGFAFAMIYDSMLAEVFGIAAIDRKFYYQIYLDMLSFLKSQCEKLLVFSDSLADVEFLLGLRFQCMAKTYFYTS